MPQTGTDRWAHPKLLLTATDLDDLDRLMPFAFAGARESGARLILLHVLGARFGMSIDPAGMPCYDPGGALEFARRALEGWSRLARQQGIRCDVLVRGGDIARQIAAAHRQFQADRILLGCRRRSRAGRPLPGPIAEQVLRLVDLPVFTVGPEAHLPPGDCHRPKVVLDATTLREACRTSVALACRIAAEEGARLVLLHVLPPGGGTRGDHGPAAMDSAAVEELDQLARNSGAAPGWAVPRVAHGDPAVEILAASVELGASLIILGATHPSALRKLTRDRTISRVIDHAPCPVLTLCETAPGEGLLASGSLAVH